MISVEAIYSNGVLKPVQDIDLDDQQRVRLTIEPVDAGPSDNGANGPDRATRAEARRRLIEFLKAAPLCLTGPLPKRDELYDAACLDAGVTRLYSEDLPGRPPPEGLEIVNPFA